MTGKEYVKNTFSEVFIGSVNPDILAHIEAAFEAGKLNNSWHDLRKNPDDLPPAIEEEDQDHWKWYLVATDYTNYKSCHYALCARVMWEWDYHTSPEWVQDDMMIINSSHVFAWKEID